MAAAFWIGALGWYLDHRIFLSSDSMNNYVHVWGIARDLWHHGHLPWRMPELGHGDAYAYPYGFANWTTAAIVWPVLGNWGVTLWSALGAVGCIAATFVAFPELRRGWWAAAVLANPAIIESLFKDILDRRGLKHAFGDLDPDIEQEIKQAWTTLINKQIHTYTLT